MNICLYGASSTELDARYYEDAYALGALLAVRGHRLIFGGGAQGIMGAAARGVHDAGGESIGIAPRFFEKPGILDHNCTEFIYTDTMQERKRLMIERSDAFVMAPGGIGTYEEFFEVLTLKQLGQHNPALAVFNTLHYYDPMLTMLEHTAQQGFAKPVCLQIFRVFRQPEPLLDYLEQYDPAEIDVRHIKNI